MEQEIQKALQTLREGKIILYPTDTTWGLGCDATNEQAVEKVLEIKKRTSTPSLIRPETNKSFIVLVSDPAMLNRFVKDVPEMAWDLIDASSREEDDKPSKPMTIIYDAARGLAENVLAEDGSIGVRLVTKEASEFCHKLIHKLGKPIVSTSANISGEPEPRDFNEVFEEIISKVDCVVQSLFPVSHLSPTSSIIKLKSNGEFKIIRE